MHRLRQVVARDSLRCEVRWLDLLGYGVIAFTAATWCAVIVASLVKSARTEFDIQSRLTRLRVLKTEERLMGAIKDAVDVLSGKVDAAQQSATDEIARVEALIAALEGSPDDPAVVAEVQGLQAKADALKAALDAERPTPPPAG